MIPKKRFSSERTKEGHEFIITYTNRGSKRELHCTDISKFEPNILFAVISKKTSAFPTKVCYCRMGKKIIVIFENKQRNVYLLGSILQEEARFVAKCLKDVSFLTVNPTHKADGLDYIFRCVENTLILKITPNEYFRDIGRTYDLKSITNLRLEYTEDVTNNFKLKLLRSMKYLPCLKKFQRIEKCNHNNFRFIASYNGLKRNNSNLLILYGFSWLRILSIDVEYHALKKYDIKYLVKELKRSTNFKMFKIYPCRQFDHDLLKNALDMKSVK